MPGMGALTRLFAGNDRPPADQAIDTHKGVNP